MNDPAEMPMLVILHPPGNVAIAVFTTCCADLAIGASAHTRGKFTQRDAPPPGSVNDFPFLRTSFIEVVQKIVIFVGYLLCNLRCVPTRSAISFACKLRNFSTAGRDFKASGPRNVFEHPMLLGKRRGLTVSVQTPLHALYIH